MGSSIRIAKPAVLQKLSHQQHAVIEASAGTGKTYTIEHIVIDLLLTRDVRIDQILVVTFTEKATSELTWRVRKTIRALLDSEDSDPEVNEEASWLIDDAARNKLRDALFRFDSAAISTIHGFCHGVLEEHAFHRGGLLEQTPADERGLFGRAFKDVLRHDFAKDPSLISYLSSWLQGSGGTVDSLESLLFDVYRRHAAVQREFEPDRVDQVRDAIVSLELDAKDFKASLKSLGVHANTANALMRHFQHLQDVMRSSQDSASVLASLSEVKLDYLRNKLSEIVPTDGLPKQLHDAVNNLAYSAPSLSAAATQLFLPKVSERLAELKEENAEYDFQDMLTLLARSLDGAGGGQLVRMLRGRYRYALVDEFQDTDDVQWDIFRRIFFESGNSNPIYVIGDPKQAIYSFRGADIHIYLDARESVRKVGGQVVPLARSYRSTPALLSAFNRIFGEMKTPPFFSGGIKYEPAEPGKPAMRLIDWENTEVAPATVFKLLWSEGGASMREVRETLAYRIANEIAYLLEDGSGRLFLGEPGEEELVREKDIFILTRSAKDGAEVGASLARLGIPHVYFKNEGLFQTDEAEDIRDVLLAIAEPRDRTKRYRAWISPFFGLTLPELAHCYDLRHDDPLIARLLDWSRLAESKDYETLFSRLVEDTGIFCRELFLRENERTVTNYSHIFEVLLHEVGRSRGTLRELISKLSAFMDERALPSGDQANVQRLESESNAVQIMTMHGAKGLEATVVFLYGGFWPPPSREVNTYYENGSRATWVGPLSEAPQHVQDSVREEQEAEDQRLLYVALTRAKGRVYLPYLPPYLDKSRKGAPKAKELIGDGCYKQLNDRLRLLLSQDPDALIDVEDVACFRLFGVPAQEKKEIALNLANWSPPQMLLTPRDDPDEFRALARKHRPHVMTSYSRMSRKSFSAPTADDTRPQRSPDQLPGGIRSGTFLHHILERLDFDTLNDRSFAEWQQDESVQGLFRKSMARFGIASSYLPHSLRLVHSALTTPVQLETARLDSGLGFVSPHMREAEFVYPYPESHHPRLSTATSTSVDLAKFRIDRGYVTGFMDFVFAHEGKTYFLDWKSDTVPQWTAEGLESYIEKFYSLQAQLYTLALVKMLDIHGEKDYLERFGGYLYCFLRGMERRKDGVFFERPAWEEILAWENELVARRVV